MKAKGMVDDAAIANLTEAHAPSPHKYSIDWPALVGVIGLAAGYLAFVYVMSFRQYRDVIVTRFGPGEEL